VVHVCERAMRLALGGRGPRLGTEKSRRIGRAVKGCRRGGWAKWMVGWVREDGSKVMVRIVYHLLW
jgi:hypothetical protein